MSNTLGTKRLGTVLALIVAFAIALAMIVTPAAHAQGLDAPGVGDQEEAEDTVTANAVANINDNKDNQASLVVHKYTAPEFGEHGNGAEITEGLPSASRKLAGAEFTIRQVTNIDLKTAAGWKTLADGKKAGSITPATVAADTANLGVAKKLETGADGVATFSNLPLGLYLVSETKVPANVTEKAADFLVTIPFPTGKSTTAVNGAEDGWLYNVHVYPKNEIDTKLKKKLADGQTAVKKGDDLKWELSIPVPTTKKALKTFKIEDTLKNGTVFSTANEPVLTLDGTELTATTDYTVSGKDSENAAITFTDAGVKKLNQNAGKKLIVNLFATVKEELAGNKVVNDNFKITYKLAQNPFDPEDPDKENPEDPGDPTTDTYTPPTGPNGTPTAYFGDYVINKKSTVGDAPIDGAIFKLYANEAAYTADTNGDQQIAIAEADPNTPGKLIFKDFYLGDTDAATKTFYLVETQAPAGFKLTPNNGHVITIHHTDAEPTSGDSFEVIKNTPFDKDDMPELPLTGASGKLLMTLGGAAIVLFAAGTVLVTRRRKA